ncbi:MAG: hypothetical protein PHW52_04035 [Candidatus Pacebacteria bacterium]|nr:hypothetical protein [Candidatus Paceibacterota bacterium]
MNNREKRFDNLILFVVVFIGLIFVGVSIKAVVKNERLTANNQASAMKIITAEDISSAKPILVDGVCGSANGQKWIMEPMNNLCKVGAVFNKRRDGQRLTWECKGSGGGKDGSCYADQDRELLDTPCGDATGGYYLEKRDLVSAGLCKDGVPGSSLAMKSDKGMVDGVLIYDKWEWECKTPAGDGSYCYANRTINGECGSANGSTLAKMPQKNDAFCSGGEYSGGECSNFDNNNESICQWKCKGINNGEIVLCSLRVNK